MNQILQSIEEKLQGSAEETALTPADLSGLPPELQALHTFRIFGGDLLAVPQELIIPGDDEEYEVPFAFLDLAEQLAIFASEFRELVPDKFHPFGYFYGSSEVVVFDTERKTVHEFHVSDVVDPGMMEYNLEKSLGKLEAFLTQLRPQTVTCFINPSDYSQFEMLEIREGNRIYHDWELGEPMENVRAEYLKLCDSLVAEDMKLNYAPKWVSEHLEE